MRILAIDYGDRAVGLAITDELRLTARPLTTIRRDRKSLQLLVAEIRRFVVEFDIVELVIGLPLNMDGSVGESAQRVMKLVERLRQEVTIPIHTVDERLTSREADDRLRARGAGRNERRMRSDEYAALIILEDFLASSGSSKALQPQNPET